MEYPELRTYASQRVEELLSSPAAKRHLASYGWVEGMPVVLADPTERVDDVMGFVSIHGRAVLLALCDTDSEHLELWHITIPSPIFTRVEPLRPETTLAELCVRNDRSRLSPFRVSFWAHSAAIHEVPCFVRTDACWARTATPAEPH
ncbi:hypothetical protein ACPROK_08005 [Glutamicibacter soli]|uniref:Uncharacterized protein n=1 Tax=Glutamicibacter soli TaxID=453836 RepID=A0A365YEY2_9MICC|nr:MULTISPECIES: hypothetical protein [Micrococcaceae]RBM01212.1 hypothetical protein C1H84_10590 [Glutamicibacter soli]RKS16241.1 hypothetical protein DFO58_3495 [Arthrobacter sp. AG1021]